MPAATATLLDDAAVNIDEWLADEVEQAFAEQEGTAFVTGDGTNKPKGFLAYTTVANASWELGQDRLHRDRRRRRVPGERSLRRADRPGLCAEGRLPPERRLRDEPQDAERRSASSRTPSGNYLWQPPATGERPRHADGLPGGRGRGHAGHRGELAARSRSAISAAAIWSSTAQGVRVLRDPFTAKPYVLFYTTKRVGGGVQDFDAIKLLKFAAS